VKDSVSHDTQSYDLVIVLFDRPYKSYLLFSPYLHIKIILIIIGSHLYNRNFKGYIHSHVTVLSKQAARSRAIHERSAKCFIFT